MKHFNDIKDYIITTCISFTIVSFTQSLLFLGGSNIIYEFLTLHVLITCVLINMAIFITDFFLPKSSTCRTIIRILDVIIIAQISNYLFNKQNNLELTYTIGSFLFTMICLIITYFITVSFVNKNHEFTINRLIKEKKEKQNG